MKDRFVFYPEGFQCDNAEEITSLLSSVAAIIETHTDCSTDVHLEIRRNFTQPCLLGMVEGDSHFHVMYLNILNPADMNDWIFQFAHEYIHHLLNQHGKRTMPSHFLWFEEMLCYISSLFFLQEAQKRGLCEEKPIEVKIPLDPGCKLIYDTLHSDLSKGLGVYCCLQPLTVAGGNPPGFSLVPSRFCYECFDAPSLWRIVKHLRNIPPEWEWKETIEALLAVDEAPDYKNALSQLVKILFP